MYSNNGDSNALDFIFMLAFHTINRFFLVMLRGTQADFPPTQVFFASQEKDRGKKLGFFLKII